MRQDRNMTKRLLAQGLVRADPAAPAPHAKLRISHGVGREIGALGRCNAAAADTADDAAARCAGVAPGTRR